MRHALFTPRPGTTITAVLLEPLADLKMHFVPSPDGKGGFSKFCRCPWDEARCPYCVQAKSANAVEGQRFYHRLYGSAVRVDYRVKMAKPEEVAAYWNATKAGRIANMPRATHEVKLMDEEGIAAVPDGSAAMFAGLGRGTIYRIYKGALKTSPFEVSMIGTWEDELPPAFDWRSSFSRIVGEGVPSQEPGEAAAPHDGLLKFRKGIA